MKLGQEIGRNEGLEAGINACISMCRDFGKPDEEIISALMSKFSLTREEATQKLTKSN